MLAHECRTRGAEQVRVKLLHLRDVMVACKERGISRTGLLPGALQVRRRAGQRYSRLNQEDPQRDPRFAEDLVNLVALAVNEENASGGRIVTAPTNGAAGIIPAVLYYAVHYTETGKSKPGRRGGALSAHRWRDRIALQGAGVHLRRGGWLPGRGRLRVIDGGWRFRRNPRRHTGTGRECG
jgi:Serine dehydratase alpha chain